MSVRLCVTAIDSKFVYVRMCMCVRVRIGCITNQQHWPWGDSKEWPSAVPNTIVNERMRSTWYIQHCCTTHHHKSWTSTYLSHTDAEQ